MIVILVEILRSLFLNLGSFQFRLGQFSFEIILGSHILTNRTQSSYWQIIIYTYEYVLLQLIYIYSLDVYLSYILYFNI